MYPIHTLANIVAMANEREQLSLTEDIKANGQRESAVLWQGSIVDGRCRQLACHTLGVDLKTRVLDDALSEEEVSRIVKSLNTRRNLTMTQKIVSAYRQQQRTQETNADIALQWAISVPSLKNCKYVAKHNPSLLDPLFNGKTVGLKDFESGYMVTTNKINTIARLIKKQLEHGNVVIDTEQEIEFSCDGQIKTEAGKDWYYSKVAALGVSNIEVRKLIAELANYKFKTTTKEGVHGEVVSSEE